MDDLRHIKTCQGLKFLRKADVFKTDRIYFLKYLHDFRQKSVNLYDSVSALIQINGMNHATYCKSIQ